jgi:DNA polymerase-3 subunit gamma/tau
MSYQVIARKWRPQAFEEVSGQPAIMQTLRNAVEHGRLHHAYLFSGARGVGKTTSARLFAKALNCHSFEKPTLTPCNNCPSCEEIAEGRSMDVLEIDAASHTGIDDVRGTIIETINVSAARDRFKVFIIDEVHQLSKPAFNALLKTLEEPPPGIVFIMATTELHKVPETILSRCQRFEFRTIATQKIFDRLKFIAAEEKVNITDEALREIARAGEGSMRDAQSAFDQAISFSGKKIEVSDVVKALGITDSAILSRVVAGIAENKPSEALAVVEELISRGHDLRNFCRDLLAHLRDLLVAKVAPGVEGLLDSAVTPAEELRRQAEHFSESDITRLFHSLADTETRLSKATQPRYLLEIGLVKLMEMRRVAPIEKILQRLAELEEKLGGKLPEEAAVVAASTTATAPATAPPTDSPVAARAPAPSPAVDTAADTAPAQEKKTSITEILERKLSAGAPPAAPFAASATAPAPAAAAAVPAAYAFQLSPEELAHFADPYLDWAFEDALRRDGDDFVFTVKTNGAAASISTPTSTPTSNLALAPATANASATTATATATASAATDASGLKKKIREHLAAAGHIWLAKAAEDLLAVNVRNGEAIFLLPAVCQYWKPALTKEENLLILAAAFTAATGKALPVKVKLDNEPEPFTIPSKTQIDADREADPETWQAAENDPAIKMLKKTLGCSIIAIEKYS